MAKTSVTWKRGAKRQTMKDEKGSITCVEVPSCSCNYIYDVTVGELRHGPATSYVAFAAVDMIEPPQFSEKVQKSPSDIGESIQTSKLLSRQSWTAMGNHPPRPPSNNEYEPHTSECVTTGSHVENSLNPGYQLQRKMQASVFKLSKSALVVQKTVL